MCCCLTDETIKHDVNYNILTEMGHGGNYYQLYSFYFITRCRGCFVCHILYGAKVLPGFIVFDKIINFFFPEINIISAAVKRGRSFIDVPDIHILVMMFQN